MEQMKHPRRRLRDWWRIPRVFYYLAIRPQDILNYCRYGAFTRKTPLELEMPWWSFGAVKYLDARLKPDSEVFEFGSGGSTIFIGARVRSLTCVEDDPEWVELVSRAGEKRRLRSISILHKPLDFRKPETFAKCDYLLSVSGKTYDVIVVDGREWSEQSRYLCFWLAENHIKTGGVIVLDDSSRYPQAKIRNRALRWKEFKGVGCCRVGVTTTCVFEY